LAIQWSPMSTTVRSATLSNFTEVAAQVGLDAAAMLREMNIDRRALTEPDLRIPAQACAELLELSAARAGCPTLGLRMAESRRLSDFGEVSLLITHQATMRDALMTVVEYRELLNESLVVHVEEHADVVIVREELLVGDQSQVSQAYELAIGVMYRLFRALLGSRWRAQSVNFTHAPPADLTIHRRVFGPIVEFNCDFNGLTCRQSDLDAPNPSADPALAQFAERYVRSLPNADRRSLSKDVQKALYLLLPLGDGSMTKVAAHLGLNERTLQRRLREEGAEFGGLLNQIRRDLTVRYLGNPNLAVSRVAGLVGYSRQTSFSRWFADEFGTSPSGWRATTLQRDHLSRSAAAPPA
ncbi:MAG: AraC family transcriptional regulator, partial [Phenylobacterium sp.]